MRLSPVLVAILAASTTFVSTAARGQDTASTDAQPLDQPQVKATASSVEMGIPVKKPTVATPELIGVAAQVVSPEQMAQATPPDPAPTTPPPPVDPTAGEEAAPQQETPDRIQFGNPPPSNVPNLPTEPSQTPSLEGTPTTPPASGQPAEPAGEASQPEPRVLVAEVAVSGAEGELQNEVYNAIRTQPGQTTTRSQLQEDINAIFATGFFSNVRAVPEDTALGVRVTFIVEPNPVLRSVQVQGNVIPALQVDGKQVPYPQVVENIFSRQYGSTLNLRQLQEGIKQLNQVYQNNGYVLAQVLEAPRISPDGTVTLEVAEGVVDAIQVRFVNKDGEDTDSKGNPIKGRTRDFIVTREFQLKRGDVFNRDRVQRDLQRVFGLGIFEDVKLSLNPSPDDPRKVVVVANVTEKNTGSLAAGAGISSASGLFGTVSYQQQNVGGNNQKLGAELQIGQRELLFDASFTDPWIAGDPYRTSYTINGFRRRSISLIFDGGPDDVKLPNGDRPRVLRTGGGLTFTRPLNRNPFEKSEWTASLGLQYQRVSIRDRDGELSPEDELGNDLSFSGTGKDDLFSLQFGVVRDRRNDLLRPTSGSLLRFGTEQTIPLGTGSILLNRLRAGYSYYIPNRLLRVSPGCRKATPTAADCPQTFAFNVQAGTILGDLPPYEAFSLGGSNSVRGYEEGDVGSARSFIQATAEYRFPVFSFIGGALFVDFATDLGSGSSVPGNPAGVRGKPGSGFGIGAGIRIQSPLGPIRIDYGFSDQGDGRLHFGIGERF